MISFTTKIKNEVTKIKSTKSEMIAELAGFVRNNGYIQDNNLYLTTENNQIKERLILFLEDLYEIKVQVEQKDNMNFSKNKLNLLCVKDNTTMILKDLGFYNEKEEYINIPPQYIVGANEEIRSYIRGVFLCQGSINDPKTAQYHMELLISKPEESVFIQKLLNTFDLNAKILTRDKGYMIYLKESEKISDYLKIINASNAVMYFEDERIYHDKKNRTNRLNNCEQANIDKVVSAATLQMDYINIIEKHMGIELLDDKTREALDYRKKYPETSLKELSEIITMETGKPITKSGLNHRFRKIKELAERY